MLCMVPTLCCASNYTCVVAIREAAATEQLSASEAISVVDGRSDTLGCWKGRKIMAIKVALLVVSAIITVVSANPYAVAHKAAFIICNPNAVYVIIIGSSKYESKGCVTLRKYVSKLSQFLFL